MADPVGIVTDGMTFLEGCGVRSGSVFAGADYCDNGPDCFACDELGDFDICPDMTFLTEPVNVVTPGVAYQENSVVLCGSVSAYDNCDGDWPDCVDYDEMGDCDGCPGVTFLGDPVYVVTEGMTYQEKIGILSGSVYDYDDYCDPDYFDYYKPNDFDDGYGFVGPVECRMCCGLHGLDGSGGSGGEDNSYWTGFGDPIAGVVCASGPDGTGDGDRPPSSGPNSPGDPGEETDLHRTGFGDPVNALVCTSGPDGTGDGDRQPSSGPNSPGDPGEENNSTLTEFGEPVIGVTPCWPGDMDSDICGRSVVLCTLPPGPGESGDSYTYEDAVALCISPPGPGRPFMRCCCFVCITTGTGGEDYDMSEGAVDLCGYCCEPITSGVCRDFVPKLDMEVVNCLSDLVDWF